MRAAFQVSHSDGKFSTRASYFRLPYNVESQAATAGQAGPGDRRHRGLSVGVCYAKAQRRSLGGAAGTGSPLCLVAAAAALPANAMPLRLDGPAPPLPPWRYGTTSAATDTVLRFRGNPTHPFASAMATSTSTSATRPELSFALVGAEFGVR